MNADDLRAVAADIREKHPWDQVGNEFHTAVADWLKAEADIWDHVLTLKAEISPKGYKVDLGLNTHAQALAVVRAWRGESS